MAEQQRTPATGNVGRGSGSAARGGQLPGAYEGAERLARLTRDTGLIAAIARFIADYRQGEHPPARTQEAALAAFPQADGSDYAAGLIEANLRRRVGDHG